MTWAFWDAICDECYAIITPDWVGPGKALNGFDLNALVADLAAL